MNLNNLKAALLTVTPSVKHNDGTGQKGNYIVYAEDGEGSSSWADDKMQNQSITGTIDYFTRIENDPKFEAIQNALDSIGISYSLNSIQYETDSKYTHYEWVWELG